MLKFKVRAFIISTCLSIFAVSTISQNKSMGYPLGWSLFTNLWVVRSNNHIQCHHKVEPCLSEPTAIHRQNLKKAKKG